MKKLNQSFSTSAMLILLALWPIQSNALTIYNYVGNNYDSFQGGGVYNSSMNVSGNFEMASTLSGNLDWTDISSSISAFSFSDGVHYFDESITRIFSFSVKTDSLGNLSSWLVHIRNPLTPPSAIPSEYFTDNIQIRSNDLASSGSSWTDFVSEYHSYRGEYGTGSLLVDAAFVEQQGAGSWVTTVVVTPVPEPETYAMLLVGLGLIGFMARRREDHTV